MGRVTQDRIRHDGWFWQAGNHPFSGTGGGGQAGCRADALLRRGGGRGEHGGHDSGGGALPERDSLVAHRLSAGGCWLRAAARAADVRAGGPPFPAGAGGDGDPARAAMYRPRAAPAAEHPAGPQPAGAGERVLLLRDGDRSDSPAILVDGGATLQPARGKAAARAGRGGRYPVQHPGGLLGSGAGQGHRGGEPALDRGRGAGGLLGLCLVRGPLESAEHRRGRRAARP